MVALTSASAGRRVTHPWTLLGLGLTLAGAIGPALFQRTGPGSVGIGLLTLLLAGAAWAVATTLGAWRAALAAPLAAVLLLNAARLPTDQATEYEWAEALYRPGQSIQIDFPVPASPTPPATPRVLVEATFSGAEPAFGVETESGGVSTRWRCAFVHGQQWLTLPPGVTDQSLRKVTLRVIGQPSREGDYLSVYGWDVPGGARYVTRFEEDGSPPAPTTRCSPA